MRSLRVLARLAVCAALTVGIAGVAVAASAPARAGIAFQSHVVASWGFDSDGDLGDGTTTDRSLYGDIKVANDVVQVAAGYYFGLALRSDGTVWQWGITASTPVRVPGLTGVTKISAGTSFNLALRSDGTVWAWGDNDRGQQLRPAGQDPSSSPATRPVSMFAAGSGITQLSAGWSHMLALKSNGTVLAWGSNIFGQLGNGSRDPVIGPVQVTGLTAAMQVAAGARGFSLAVHTVPYLVGL